MKFRHEFKHEISEFDSIHLQTRFDTLLDLDKNASKDGIYNVKSLYFDNIFDSALLEKINGVNSREKFRIRSYNDNNNFIRLEKKSKINGLCNKVSAIITEEEVQKIISGDIAFLENADRPLLVELFYKMKNSGLKSKTIVLYTRKAYTYNAGNVRITLDYNIRTGLLCNDFLNSQAVTIPAGDKTIILEVKWDEFLPGFINNIIGTAGRQSAAFSKYAACRIYG